MNVAILRERLDGERRVALVPGVANQYAKRGWKVRIESGAGRSASFPDSAYRAAGVEVVQDATSLLKSADLLLVAGPPPREVASMMREGAAVAGSLNPLGAPEGVETLRALGLTAFALELLPRITRAQGMDALSSQATVAGYVAVLEGAREMTRFLPMLTTAAGTIRPAGVLVLGAGVAGLQAIATARRLGAVVSAFDIRPAVREQVQSLGARFIEAELAESSEDEGGYAAELSEEQHRLEMELIAGEIGSQDLVIATAQIPGKKAPVLVTREMVESMAPGSVIVDLAATTGGNCELTRAGVRVTHGEVTILGPRNLPARLPDHASRMYARNLADFAGHVFAEDGTVDLEDEIASAACVARGGDILNARVRELSDAARSEGS